eukprot:CAMPEP_0172624036 /NCGR_PEP_ID=MMETSP1068-20121228/133470_1 /TAXON_ID=35684 /ORGANISM="Pseudopedinella elastica, Strain CCMP716" /LENGTH=56 /DNA_ID=CAMNT_0013432825 /DNA_START=235 /DNA_END=405 /DNA_ORIENTATION=-
MSPKEAGWHMQHGTVAALLVARLVSGGLVIEEAGDRPYRDLAPLDSELDQIITDVI